MRVEQIEVGKTYERAEVRIVVDAHTHSDGETEVKYFRPEDVLHSHWTSAEEFARWAVREVPHAN